MRLAIASALWFLVMTVVGAIGRRARRRGAQARTRPPAAEKAPDKTAGLAYPFDFDVLHAEAKRLAAKPYTPRRSTSCPRTSTN